MRLEYYSEQMKTFNKSSLQSELSIMKKLTSNHAYTCIKDNIYVNIPFLPSKPIDLLNDETYTTLTNATSCKRNTNSLTSHIYINLEKKLMDIDDLNELKSDKIEMKSLVPSSNADKFETDQKHQVNIAPNSNDKSILYRTKMPTKNTRILPSLYQRTSTPLRPITNSNPMKKLQERFSNRNSGIHIPRIITRTQKSPVVTYQPMKSVSNQLYDEIEETVLYDDESQNSVYADGTPEVLQYPLQFHGTLHHQIFSWYPIENYREEELIQTAVSTSENDESNQQDDTINDEEEEEEEEEINDDDEEEPNAIDEAQRDDFFPHDTFQNFLLRRRPKSSTSTAPSTGTLVSSETLSNEPPVRLPTYKRQLSGVALGLDKHDVDFIQDILQRTHGNDRVSNRITALREAYVRALNRKNNFLEKTQVISKIDENRQKKKMTMKQSFVASKIRDELKRYDQLPFDQRTNSFYEDEDEDDNMTYSTNDDHRFSGRSHHRYYDRHRQYHHRRRHHHHHHIHHHDPTTSTAHRIVNFVTTLKRQIQKNFHDIRSRILIETMTIPSNHGSRHHHRRCNSSGLSRRQACRSRMEHNNFHRPSSLQSHHRHSNMSQNQNQRYLPSNERNPSHRKQTFRITPYQQRSFPIH